ncbi:zinc finger protein [Branchiostoma belcheri]|nr:zinc finger protein [Branchiostoma belcheri]
MPVQSKQHRDKIVGLRFLSKDTIQFKDVLELVQKHGAQRGDIKGIQNKGKGVCEVMFTSQAALAKVAPTLALDTAVDCELFGKNFTVVTAIGIPMDMDDNYVRHRLQAYWTIDASRLLTYANLGFPEILSGTRQYRIKLKEHIPGSFRIGNDLIGIRYSGQPKLCHRCGSEEHFVADCTAVKCNKCCEIGHKADVCVNEIKCNICGETGHAGRACQLSFANRLSMGTSWAKPVTASTTSEHTKSSGPAETSPTETSSTAKSGDAARPAEADGREEQDLEGAKENENEVSMGANEEEGMLPKLPFLTQALPGAGDTAQQTAPKPGTKPPREQVVKSNSPAKTKVCKAAPTTTDLPDEAQTLPKLLKGTPESTPLPEEGGSKWMSDTEDTEIAQSADGLSLKLDESGDHISEYSSEDESATKRPLSSPSESSPSESEDSDTTRRPDKKIKKEAGKTAKGTGKVSPLSGNREVTYKTKSVLSSRKRGRKGQVRLATNQAQSIKGILGDFNAKNSNWLASNTTDNPGRQLENLFLNHGLEQVLHELTRGGNLLDLIATSHPAKCYQTGTLAPLGDSDHLITATALTIQASQHSGKRLVWLYDKADIEALHQDIALAEGTEDIALAEGTEYILEATCHSRKNLWRTPKTVSKTHPPSSYVRWTLFPSQARNCFICTHVETTWTSALQKFDIHRYLS